MFVSKKFIYLVTNTQIFSWLQFSLLEREMYASQKFDFIRF
jgi:hypothetical protein